MKTTKTIITAILLCFFAFANAQQKKELTKEETVKYINDEYVKIPPLNSNVLLDNKILIVGGLRRNIMVNQPVEIIKDNGRYLVLFKDAYYPIFYTYLESDAKRLKNALEHLIKLLKAEPETDPFAN